MTDAAVCVVVPTIGRPSLQVLLDSLLDACGTDAPDVVVVDDRRDRSAPLPLPTRTPLTRISVVTSGGRGPAAARNRGWRATSSRWVAFLDDDVVVPATWYDDLLADLDAAPIEVGGVQGQVRVPRRRDGRLTDWERQTVQLETASWITADMAYRRTALQCAGGFDERFPRAFREDCELALRVRRLGWRLQRGRRWCTHPVRDVPWYQSLRVQAGNADDALMRRLHGATWRSAIGAPRGTRSLHLALTGAGAAGIVLTALRRRRAAGVSAFGWALGVGWLAGRRTTRRPRDAAEVARMLSTSLVLSPLAAWHTARGAVLHRGVRRWRTPQAVLFDRDGTLVRDVPYNADAALVDPVDGAAELVAALRARGIRVGVVTNQSGVARGLIRPGDLEAVNAAIDREVGPFDVWEVCPHDDGDGCPCRKPEPGLVLAAARRLGVDPHDVVVVGDIGTDVEAARRAGARAVLVPTDDTDPRDVARAPVVAGSLCEAVVLAVGVLP